MEKTSKYQKFWKYVVKSNDINKCWGWNASLCFGYGQVNQYENGKYKKYFAHRLSWEIHNGTIPSGLCILHKCDNPICCNPNHLFLGTKRDNIIDCYSKKRRPINNWCQGEKNPSSKLNEKNIIDIRQLLNKGLKQLEIALSFNISQSTVSSIKRNKLWSCIDGNTIYNT